jgi:hypothetical protein
MKTVPKSLSHQLRLSRLIYYLRHLLLGGACWRTLQPAAAQQALPQPVVVASAPYLAQHPTRFPDTFRAQPVEVTYWNRQQVDSIQAALGTSRWERQQRLVDSTARCRVFLGDGTDDLQFRLFYRPLATPTRWVEFNLNPWLRRLNPWLKENDNYLAYMHAYVVNLDRRGPEEIMVKTGGGTGVQGYRTVVDQTLLLSLDGPPRLLWQSIDGRSEEVPSTPSVEQGERVGGNLAERSRTVAMRKGLVYVSSINKSGKFEEPDPHLTPITPGYYQYQKSRFRRVTPPKVASQPKP